MKDPQRAKAIMRKNRAREIKLYYKATVIKNSMALAQNPARRLRE